MLAGRKTAGKIQGAVLYGGVAPTTAFLRRYTGYVEQFDTLLGNLTVRENLQYTAELKARVDLPYPEKMARVDRSIAQLGLQVGVRGRGLVGDQRENPGPACSKLGACEPPPPRASRPPRHGRLGERGAALCTPPSSARTPDSRRRAARTCWWARPASGACRAGS